MLIDTPNSTHKHPLNTKTQHKDTRQLHTTAAQSSTHHGTHPQPNNTKTRASSTPRQHRAAPTMRHTHKPLQPPPLSVCVSFLSLSGSSWERWGDQRGRGRGRLEKGSEKLKEVPMVVLSCVI